MVGLESGLNLSSYQKRDLVLLASTSVLAHPVSGVVIVAFVVAGCECACLSGLYHRANAHFALYRFWSLATRSYLVMS
jgi:hypothetical protein